VWKPFSLGACFASFWTAPKPIQSRVCRAAFLRPHLRSVRGNAGPDIALKIQCRDNADAPRVGIAGLSAGAAAANVAAILSRVSPALPRLRKTTWRSRSQGRQRIGRLRNRAIDGPVAEGVDLRIRSTGPRKPPGPKP
jgi:hypothetical protein